MTKEPHSKPESPWFQQLGAWRLHFAKRLLAWHARYGRHGLPWHGHDPYRIWISEVMLQQTQVATVIPYFQRFIATWPTVEALAAAPLDDVLAAWSGLGYYARARALHAAARHVVTHWPQWPRDPMRWAELPGVGRSTAAAICAFAFGVRTPILDGNVQRLLVRLLGITQPLDAQLCRALWPVAEALLPEDPLLMPAYTQAQMDLGALVCTRATPACPLCPLADGCAAHTKGLATALPVKPARRPVAELPWRLRAYRCGNQFWWVRRPPRGIWGGLWSLPLASDPAPPGIWVAEGEIRLPPHRLTHRLLTLTIEAWTIATSHPPTAHLLVTTPAGRWASAAEASTWGIPQPLRRWIATLLPQARSDGPTMD